MSTEALRRELVATAARQLSDIDSHGVEDQIRILATVSAVCEAATRSELAIEAAAEKRPSKADVIDMVRELIAHDPDVRAAILG